MYADCVQNAGVTDVAGLVIDDSFAGQQGSHIWSNGCVGKVVAIASSVIVADEIAQLCDEDECCGFTVCVCEYVHMCSGNRYELCRRKAKNGDTHLIFSGF